MNGNGQDERHTGSAVLRGLGGRCPRCGAGRMFDGWLRVVDACGRCGLRLGDYPAASGPAFLTLLAVWLLLLVPVLGTAWVLLRPDPLPFALAGSAAFAAVALLLLRPIRGAIVGFLWAADIREGR